MDVRALVRPWAFAAAAFTLGAATLSWKTSSLRADLAEHGVVANVSFVRWETGPGQRGGECRHAVYSFTLPDGRIHDARHGCFLETDAPPTLVTYLPNSPDRQLPGTVAPFSRVLEAAISGAVAAAVSLLMLGVGLLFQGLAARIKR